MKYKIYALQKDIQKATSRFTLASAASLGAAPPPRPTFLSPSPPSTEEASEHVRSADDGGGLASPLGGVLRLVWDGDPGSVWAESGSWGGGPRGSRWWLRCHNCGGSVAATRGTARRIGASLAQLYYAEDGGGPGRQGLCVRGSSLL